jgi:hypothetical protein
MAIKTRTKNPRASRVKTSQMDPSFVDAHFHHGNKKSTNKHGIINKGDVRFIRATNKDDKSLPTHSIPPVSSMRIDYNKGIYYLPPFQRHLIWKDPQKRSFLKSIKDGHPTPGFVTGVKGVKRAIIDGQQRFKTLVSFINGDKKSVKLERKTFEQLSEKDQDIILRTTIAITETTAPESEWEDIYIKINASGTKISKAEILHAKSHSRVHLRNLEDLSEKPYVAKFLGAFRRFAGYGMLVRAVAFHFNWNNYVPIKGAPKFILEWATDSYHECDTQTLKNLDWLFRLMEDHWSYPTLRDYLYSSSKSRSPSAARACLFIHVGLKLIEALNLKETGRGTSNEDKNYREYLIRGALLKLTERIGDQLGYKTAESSAIYQLADTQILEMVNSKGFAESLQSLYKKKVKYPVGK